MTDAEVAATAIAAVAMHDEDSLRGLVSAVGGERVIRSLALFAYWQLRGRNKDVTRSALQGKLRQVVQLMDRPHG